MKPRDYSPMPIMRGESSSLPTPICTRRAHSEQYDNPTFRENGLTHLLSLHVSTPPCETCELGITRFANHLVEDCNRVRWIVRMASFLEHYVRAVPNDGLSVVYFRLSPRARAKQPCFPYPSELLAAAVSYFEKVLARLASGDVTLPEINGRSEDELLECSAYVCVTFAYKFCEGIDAPEADLDLEHICYFRASAKPSEIKLLKALELWLLSTLDYRLNYISTDSYVHEFSKALGTRWTHKVQLIADAVQAQVLLLEWERHQHHPAILSLVTAMLSIRMAAAETCHGADTEDLSDVLSDLILALQGAGYIGTHDDILEAAKQACTNIHNWMRRAQYYKAGTAVWEYKFMRAFPITLKMDSAPVFVFEQQRPCKLRKICSSPGCSPESPIELEAEYI